jgi:hypothetical protein
MERMIRVLQPWTKVTSGIKVNTTSRAEYTWSKSLSPFYLGPCDLYASFKSRNMENGWQYSKVYKEFLDVNGSIKQEYFDWAKQGWNDTRAERYPMGKGIKPEFSLWDRKRLNYVDARKEIYVPLYVKAVVNTDAFQRLKEIYQEAKNTNTDLILQDFDAYDHNALDMTYQDVINNPKRKMGHAFVLAMLLDEFIPIT